MKKKPRTIDIQLYGIVPYLFFRWGQERVDHPDLRIHGWSSMVMTVHPTICGIGKEDHWYDGPIKIYKFLLFEVCVMAEFHWDRYADD